MNIKKLLCVLFILIIMISTPVLAYIQEEFEIEVPERFSEVVDEDSEMKVFKSITDNFNIIVKQNTNNADVCTFTEEQIKAIENEIDLTLEKANMPNEILSSKVVNINNYDALLIKSQCKKTAESEIYIYQYKYIFTSENNVYYITYSTNQKELFSEFEKTILTFKIKDTLLEKSEISNNQFNTTSEIVEDNNMLFLMIILIIIMIVLIGAIIIVFIKLRK